jgi:hypothetical protein
LYLVGQKNSTKETQQMSNTTNVLSISTLTLTLTLLGCSSENHNHGDDQVTTATEEVSSDEHTHAPQKGPTAGHGGPIIQLGTSTIGSFNVMATRDVGEIIAGKDAPIDVTVTPVEGSPAQAVAVRFWIGTQDAMGSIKAKSEIENPAEPNRWHTHAEVPNPIPTGSRLWVEIEIDNGEKVTGSFDLLMEAK